MRVILMSNNKKKKTSYESFDSWIKSAKNSINELIEEAEREVEEEERKKKQSYQSGKKPTVFRKFSDNKDVKELFPKKESNNKKSGMNKRSYEGNVNSKGSISGKSMMGPEGDPVNPDLRKRLEEKRAKELREKKQQKLYKKDIHYKRKSVKDAEKHEKIDSYKKTLKNKENFRKAIIMSEILAPPLAKRKKF